VWVNGERVRDPGARIAERGARVSVRRRRFVSRGGEKLDSVLQTWGVEVAGLVFIDAGSSTGGFTDCLLQRGARRVVAVDVGSGLLDYRLRRDARVTVLESTNVIALCRDLLPEQPDAAVADLSFRSLRGAAGRLISLTRARWLIALVKPQFEWTEPIEGFDGVLRDPDQIGGILRALAADLRREGVHLHRVSSSALRGAKGNREFFFLLKDSPGPRGAEELLDELRLEGQPG